MKLIYLFLTVTIMLSACGKDNVDRDFNDSVNFNKSLIDMALNGTDVDVSIIQTTLGTTSGSIETLCTHPNINPWAFYKPAHIDGVYTNRHGLYRETFIPYKIEYRKPYNDFRLGDFRLYNHTAVPPVVFEITGVKLFNGTNIWNNGNPVFLQGGAYYVSFRFRRGDIDPSTINSQTRWTKVANSYGGILIKYNNSSYDEYNVWNVTSSWTQIDDYYVTVDDYNSMPFEVCYAQQVAGIYSPTIYKIESSYSIPPNYNNTWWSNYQSELNKFELLNYSYDTDTRKLTFEILSNDYDAITEWLVHARGWTGSSFDYPLQGKLWLDVGNGWEYEQFIYHTDGNYEIPEWIEYLNKFKFEFTFDTNPNIVYFGGYTYDGHINVFSEIEI